MSENSRPLSLWFDRADDTDAEPLEVWSWAYDEAADEYTLGAGHVPGGAGFVKNDADPDDYVLQPLSAGKVTLQIVKFGDDLQIFA
jgi:hypothetical protein